MVFGLPAFDSLVGTANTIFSTGAKMVGGSAVDIIPPSNTNGARQRFDIDSHHWNIGKSSWMFSVNFVINKNLQNMVLYPDNDFQPKGDFSKKIQQSTYLSKIMDEMPRLTHKLSGHVKTIDRPNINFETTEYNQYNRKRLVHGKAKYEPFNITFYDTVDSTLLKILTLYLAIMNDSFYAKTPKAFSEYNLLSEFVPYWRDWGSNVYLSFQFFERIDILEFYDNKVTVYNYNNPKITSINLTPTDITSGNGVQEITVRFDYEGLTFGNPTVDNGETESIVGAPMTPQLSELARIKWEGSVATLLDLGVGILTGLREKNGLKFLLQNAANNLGLGEELKFVDNIRNVGKNPRQLTDPKFVFNQITNPTSLTGTLSKVANPFTSTTSVGSSLRGFLG